MQDELEVSVEDLLAQLKRKGIPLQSEIGAFIALEACEQIVDSPVRLSASHIAMGEIGEIMVEPSGGVCSEADAVKSLLRLLGELLVCAAPGVSPMLLELVEQGPSDGQWTLARLQSDLEACLLPLNRGATRRVLARLLREVHREGERTSQRPSDAPDAADLDAELDGLLGGESGPTSRAKVDPPKGQPLSANAGIEIDTDAERDDEPTGKLVSPLVSPPKPVAPIPPLSAAIKAASRTPAEAHEDHPKNQVVTKIKTPNLDTVEDLFDGEPKPRSGGAVLGGMFVFIAVVLAIAYATVGQHGARKLLGLAPADQERSVPTPSAAAPKAVAGELTVTSTPARAQVFLLVGSGPAMASGLPVGVAHEFVALAEGRAPARALVTTDASWEQTPDGPRYELAMQTGKEAAAADALELGTTLLPAQVGTPTGQLGTVRVITTPPGAKVYQLVGFTPEVHVQNLTLDRGYDLLVYAPGYEAEQRHLESGDFRPGADGKVAALDITLRKRSKR